jgi:hypothetical protein
MYQVVSAKPLKGFRLEITFADGLHGQVSLAERLFGPVFEPLKDETEFQKVAVDEFGAIAWPCGADLAPDAIYQRLASHVTA